MPINPSIAMGFQQPQIESPLNAMARFMQIQGAQQESELNQLRMQELKRAADEKTKLTNLFANPAFKFESPESLAEVIRAAPSSAGDFAKMYTQMQKDQREAEKAKLEGMSQVIRMGRDLLAAAPNQQQWTAGREFIRKNAPELVEHIPEMWSPVNQRLVVTDADALRKQIEQKLAPYTVGSTRVVPDAATGAQTTVFTEPTELDRLMEKLGKVTDPKEKEIIQKRIDRLTEFPPQVVISSTGVPTVIKGTTAITPTTPKGEAAGEVGKPSENVLKERQEKEKVVRDINLAIPLIKEAIKPGGYLDKATSGAIGAGVDALFGFVGATLPGAKATGQLQVIQDVFTKMIPRFEGPQSKEDAQSYTVAAGQAGNPNIPKEIRKAALGTLLEIMIRRKDQFELKKPESGTQSSSTAEPGGELGSGTWRVVR